MTLLLSSSYAPVWRRWLHRHASFLFKKCPDLDGQPMEYGNYHWRWDTGCKCVDGGACVRGWD